MVGDAGLDRSINLWGRNATLETGMYEVLAGFEVTGVTGPRSPLVIGQWKSRPRPNWISVRLAFVISWSPSLSLARNEPMNVK